MVSRNGARVIRVSEDEPTEYVDQKSPPEGKASEKAPICNVAGISVPPPRKNYFGMNRTSRYSG